MIKQKEEREKTKLLCFRVSTQKEENKKENRCYSVKRSKRKRVLEGTKNKIVCVLIGFFVLFVLWEK